MSGSAVTSGAELRCGVGPALRASVEPLWVAAEQHWVATTSCRVAGDGYSWMQAVHWVSVSGLYTPRRYRRHGPRAFSRMTLYVAQLLSELSPCRPGIDYLVRRTGLSERSVEYHLQMLRETGLLVWETRGTRVRGERARASVYVPVIPVAFDVALGVRTAGEGAGRRVIGIAEAGRKAMAKLAARAARRVRKPRSKSSSKASERAVCEGATTAVSASGRCTPMEGGTDASSAAVSLSPPSEKAKLASGKTVSPSPSKPKSSPTRRLNRVGRRYQLAAQLVAQVPWLGRAAVPRIAWIVKDVADAGWTAEEVHAWLSLADAPDTEQVRRPSGFLARRLATATSIWPTKASRSAGMEAWRDSHRATRQRHRETDATFSGPRSPSVRRRLATALQAAFNPLPQDYDQGVLVSQDDTSVDGLTPQDIAELRSSGTAAYADGDPSLVTLAIEVHGLTAAQRIYGADLVHRAQRLATNSRHMNLAHR